MSDALRDSLQHKTGDSTNASHSLHSPHSPHALDALDAGIIAGLQGDFPLTDSPFAQVGKRWGLSAQGLQQRLSALLARKTLTRFGPMFQIERMGGAFLLAAMCVPENRFEAIAAQLDALPAVAHNYRREHALNMWFVLATATPQGIQEAMDRIAADSGLQVFGFRKLREYYVGMHFASAGMAHDSAHGAAPLGHLEPRDAVSAAQLDALDWQLIRASQSGLPLVDEPWQALGEPCGLSGDEVCQRFAAMLDSGVIRRIGAVPNHYALGYTANGMAVFDVDDDQVDALGEQLGRLPVVSHCYRRERHEPLWPYNLFAMCHGSDRAQVIAQVTELRNMLGSACRGHEVLFSSRILKKTGVRI